MMIIEPTMAARFSAPALSYNRSMWSTDDVNGLVHAASSRIARACCLDTPWGRSKKSVGTLFTRRDKLVKNRIQASAERSRSAKGPVEPNGKPSYHPFEEIADSALQNSGDARLTTAETGRTIIEVNSKATLMFSSLINDETHENIIWPDMPYLTDEHGNIYFQVKSGEDIFQSLTSENNFVQVIVGVDTMEMISEMDLSAASEIDFGIEEFDNQDSSDVEDDDEEDEDEDGNDDYDSEWVAVFSDEDGQDDADETLEGWAKLETMHSYSDPMYFAKKLAEIASGDPIDWMEQPPACLAIQGLLRPAFIEEQSVIQKHLSTNLSSNTDMNEPKGNSGKNLGVINGQVDNPPSSRDNASQLENNDIPANATSFFKLEMVKIQLFSAHGHPADLEVEHYMEAQPDAIAHSASKIISRLKADGEKTTQALKSLCWRCKGIQVEEAQLICVDSLGFDLRVCSGTQVETLRFAFKKRATSEYSAERQLNDLLFARSQQKQQKMKQTHQNES
ncbi:uncharacterized protein At3g49140-like [Neltuma alba]|uniref:uncharacterized protein At3g49140-like n=1 Tax=Neltuma alba TaxID=207710 RepID=UPI0010A5049B|nr:uncharacterized protein At3g49140-like [Prosopis alba]